MISSTFNSTEFDQHVLSVWSRWIERVDRSKFELSSTFDPTLELYRFGSTQIDHSRVPFCLRVKTSLSAKPFIWKWVPPTGSFSCKSNSFSFEWFCTSTRFETEAQGNSEMAYCNSVRLKWSPTFALHTCSRFMKYNTTYQLLSGTLSHDKALTRTSTFPSNTLYFLWRFGDTCLYLCCVFSIVFQSAITSDFLQVWGRTGFE